MQLRNRYLKSGTKYGFQPNATNRETYSGYPRANGVPKIPKTGSKVEFYVKNSKGAKGGIKAQNMAPK